MKMFIHLVLLSFVLAFSLSPVQTSARGDDVSSTQPMITRQRLRFEHLTPKEGLLSLTARGMVQDSQGFMWFATANGLYRYDGYTCKAFHHDPDDPHSVSSDNMYVLYEDHEGVLWMGTRNAGLNTFDRATEQFTRYLHDPDDPSSLSHNRVNAIYEDQRGILWVGTDGGLDRFNRASGQFIHYRHDPDDPSSLSHNRVRAIVEDTSGQLWLGTQGGGLNMFDPATEHFTHYQHDPDNPHGLSHDDVWAITVDVIGNLWVGTAGGLDRFDLQTGQITHYRHDPNDPHSVSDNDVLALYTDESGEVWIGTTSGGLNLFDPETETFTHYQHDPTNPHSFWGEWIEFIYADRAGALWISTVTDGVNRLDRGTATFELYQHHPNDPQSLSQGSVWAIFQDRLGTLWVGTIGGGLNRFDPVTGGFRHYQNDPTDPHSLSHNQVYDIVEDSTGNLWVSTRRGLNQFDRESEQFTHYTHDPDNPDSLSENWTIGLYIDRSDRLWVGTFGGGLNTFDPATEHFRHYHSDPENPNSLSDNRIVTIAEDPSGLLWLGTHGGGLNKFDPETETFTPYRHDPDNPNSVSSYEVLHIHIDQAGILWLATSGGLDKFDPQTETFTHYREKDGLVSKNLVSVVADEQGNLWLGTHGSGLSHFDPDSETFRNYDQSDGLQDDEFLPQGAYKDASGKIYFGGKNGLNAFYPDQLTDNPYIPPVVLTDFQVFNQSVPIRAEDSLLQKVINETDEITLSYQQSVFSFEFAALNYRAPEKNQYAYMLKGFDKDWNYVDSARRFATYTNLDPGTYTFRVKASNNDGVWNEAGKTIKITITPPWWETWWFYMLCAAGVLGIFGLVYQSKVSQLHAERAAALALRESEERSRSIFSQSPIGIELYDKEGHLIDANPVCLDMFGVKNLEVIKGFKLFEDPNLPEDAKQRLLNGESVRYEIMFDFEMVKAQNLYKTTKSGQCFLECFLTQWGSGSGNLKGFLVHVTDITERKQAEEAQRKSAEQYHSITSTSMDGFAVVDLDEHLLDVNEAYSRMIGYSRDELLKMSVSDIEAISTPEEIQTKHQKAMAGSQLFESRHRRKDGRIIDVEISMTFMPQAGQILVFLRDITERKRAEETLRESEERYRQLFELESDAIFLIENETGRILEANSAASALYGYSHKELLTKKNTDLSAEPEDTQRVTQTTLPTSDQIVTIPLRFHRKRDGTIFPVEITGRFFIRQGRPVHIAAIRDITERKQMEEALRENEEKYRTLAENSPIGIFVSDAERFIYANQHLCKITGFSRDELLNMPDPVGSLFVPEERERLLTYVQSHLSGSPVPTDYEARGIRKDGKEISLKLTVVSIVLSGRRVLQGTVEDISERKRAEKQLKNQNLLLEQAVQEKQREMEVLFERLLRQEKLATIGQMAGSIAHELRNPLGAIKNSVFFLKRLWQKHLLDVSNPKVQKHLDLIDNELDTSERVIAYLLQITQMKPPRKEPIDLRPIIADAVERCHLPKQIQCTIELHPEPFLISADPMQLRQVLINLLTNAVQAIEQEGYITISAKQLSEDGSTVIEVQDTGTGIDLDVLDKVFEPLYTTKTTGTGLGLSICKQIIENHQGRISIMSQVRQGTTVTIVLPDSEDDKIGTGRI